MPTSMMILLKNPAFVCQCLISSVEGFLLSGLSTFLPKFIANQYNQTNSWAAMLTGFIAVPGAAFGQFIGGVIVRKFRLKVRGIIRFNMACTAAVILLVAVFWAKCEQGAVAGVTVTYTNKYKYVNCSCAMSQASNTSSIFSSSNETINEAVLGKCKSNCKLLYVFIPVVFLALLGTFMMAVPGTTIILRSVNDKQRTFAISMQQMCMRFIGTIPGPLVFGYILDQVCIVWQEKCGSTGSCWVYNSDLMGQHFFIMGVCVKAVTLTLLTIAYCLYKPPATDAAVSGQHKHQNTLRNAAKCKQDPICSCGYTRV
ncbi:SLCO4C1 [Bugula neritina]|uniref:SLCO4C1 n=1 Tax=Bugula neritina TaxID=10212 RepID=A0A7J7KI12_BUGNE|nr:SLCO4C1 [Bugula neritina]